MTTTLERLFAEILREAKTNREFADRISEALRLPEASPVKTPTGRARNRREPGVIDPYREFTRGADHLRGQLLALSVEQLKDIISEQAMDSSRLALKWKSADRLVDLIVRTVRARVEKGDVFRE